MNTDKKEIKDIKISQQKHELKVGSHEGGLDLMVKMKMDGKVVQEFKGRSFLQLFAYGLHANMHGGKANRLMYSISQNSYSVPSSEIVVASNASPILIKTRYSRFQDVVDGDLIYVWGVQGNTAANGLWKVQTKDDDELYLYEMDGITPVAGNGAFTNPYDTIAGNAHYCVVGMRESGVERGDNGFTSDYHPNQSWKLKVGDGTTPVKITDFGLYNGFGRGTLLNCFQEADTQISVQITNKPSSRFTITRAFTNASGAVIDINEIAIMCSRMGFFDNSDQNYMYSAIARDILPSAVSVPTGKTLTIEYEVIANLIPDTLDTDVDGTNGGFINRFITDLRTFAKETSTASDINMWKFSCNSAPGTGTLRDQNSVAEWVTGIRLGTDNTYVSMTDSTVLGEIVHGEADGELFHYGNLVEQDMIVDTVNDKCIIEIKRIFQNKGSTDIEVKEVALYANRGGSSTFSPQMIARTALAPTDQYTIPAGAFVQVQYDIVIEA